VRRFFPLLLVTTCLCTAPAHGEGDARAAEASEQAEGVLTRSEVVGDVSAARPTPIDPIRGIHAEAIFPFEGVGVFASTHGFALSRRTALYHVEGGASIPLDDGVRLTASYRMLGMDFGFDSDVESADMEHGLAAPFVGLAIDF
jgi:hypothetical protein